MADLSRGNELCSFFIYDHNVLKREEDDLKDAIVYFYPNTVSVDDQCALVGKLIGISDFFFHCLPQSSPRVIKLLSEKFATQRHGDFTVALGCDLFIPDDFITHHFEFVWKVFVFFQGSLEAVRQRCKNNQSFPAELAKVWEMYLPFCQFYGDLLSQAFQILPDVQLSKSSCKTFLHASHILQRCHRQQGVIGGALLYKSKVLSTQLSPDVTKRLLLLKPQQNHLPCQEIKPDFELPGGLRLLRVFMPSHEYCRMSGRRQTSLRSKPRPSSNRQFLLFDTKAQMPADLSSVPTLDCDSAFSPEPPPPLKDIVQRMLSGGNADFDDEPESLQTNKVIKTNIKSQESSSVKIEGETSLPKSGETREIIHNHNKASDLKTEFESGPDSGFKEVKEIDIRRFDGVHKTFAEDENCTKKDMDDCPETDSKSKEDVLVVVDSAIVGNSVVSSDKPNHGEDATSFTLSHDQNWNNQKGISSNVNEVTSLTSGVCESSASPKLDASKTREDGGKVETDFSNVGFVSESSGIIPKSEIESLNDLDSGHHSSGRQYESEISSHTVLDGDLKNESEGQNLAGSSSSPEVSSVSHSALRGTGDEYIEEDGGHVTGTSLSQSEPAGVTDSENDAVTPQSCDDKPFGRSGGTVSSVSDDCMSSHKETLEFTDDHTVSTTADQNSEWPWKSPTTASKNVSFVPSSESYVSSSYSHSEGETSGSWMAESDGLVDLTLYVQGHSEMLLLLLLENGVNCDKPLVTKLWRGSLPHLAELDFEVKESLESHNTEERGVGSYNFLRYDSFTRNVSGNVIESVTGAAHEFVGTSAKIHHYFQQNPNMVDILLRSHTASVYGHQSVSHETFFQINAPQRHTGGYPQPKDIVFTLDQVAAQKLQTDHDLTLL
ncbi:BLOC-3 complex member HPS4-like isoform X2 [Haliotis asinina]